MTSASKNVAQLDSDTVPGRLLVDHLLAVGRPVVTLDDIAEITGQSSHSARSLTSRLARQGKLTSLGKGLYVAVPADRRAFGAPDPTWYVDAIARHHGRRYYVGLLTAAAHHGASHQQPMTYQVAVDRPLTDRTLGRTHLAFHVARFDEPVEGHIIQTTTYTGRLRVADPELTVYGLLAHRDPAATGGLGNIATVLAELINGGTLHLDRLGDLASAFPRATTRRLCWLVNRLDTLGHLDEPAPTSARLLAACEPDVGDPTPLDMHGDRHGPTDPDTAVQVNAGVEPDL